MKLMSFRVKDFRSIADSTVIRVENEKNLRTVLVGRNESGKSSLLRALHSLNPGSGGLKPWGLARDFPRTRKRRDFREDLTMLETTWALSESEQAELRKIWPRCAGVTTVQVSRSYAPKRTVEIPTEKTLSDLVLRAKEALTGLEAAMASIAFHTDVTAAVTALKNTVIAARFVPAPVNAAVAAVRAAMTATTPDHLPPLETHLTAIEAPATAIANDATQRQAAHAWVEKHLPPFVYLDDWDFIPGHHNIRQYLDRVANKTPTGDDELFGKMLQVAELDAAELQSMLSDQHEERKLLTDRASNIVTATMTSLWKDRELTVQFNVDADHFDVIVKDKDSNALVPLDERSRGFRWYFSFFITFAADTDGGEMEDAILLLDEPGLYLHALAQEALLDFFKTLPRNQIVYSTHSPFMIEPANLAAVRTVNLSQEKGTVASADPTGDAKTLFPLQAALGYSLSQTLFIGTDNVVVEGVTDYWYLTAASDSLRDVGKGFDPDVVLTPAGGAPKVIHMVALLTANKLNAVVLLDQDGAGDQAAEDLLKNKIVRERCIVRVGQAAPALAEADIEDLLDAAVFETLAGEAYKKELAGKTLALNPNVPRIVRRFEQAFEAIGLEFNKTRVAKLFVGRMATDANSVFDQATQERFAELIRLLNAAVKHLKARSAEPFSN